MNKEMSLDVALDIIGTLRMMKIDEISEEKDENRKKILQKELSVLNTEEKIAIATTSGVAIALYLPVNSAFIYSDSFRYCFFAHRYLQHHRNCIPLFLGYMFAHLQLFFLWTDN